MREYARFWLGAVYRRWQGPVVLFSVVESPVGIGLRVEERYSRVLTTPEPGGCIACLVKAGYMEGR